MTLKLNRTGDQGKKLKLTTNCSSTSGLRKDSTGKTKVKSRIQVMPSAPLQTTTTRENRNYYDGKI